MEPYQLQPLQAYALEKPTEIFRNAQILPEFF